jgi:hypothetical protein
VHHTSIIGQIYIKQPHQNTKLQPLLKCVPYEPQQTFIHERTITKKKNVNHERVEPTNLAPQKNPKKGSNLGYVGTFVELSVVAFFSSNF